MLVSREVSISLPKFLGDGNGIDASGVGYSLADATVEVSQGVSDYGCYVLETPAHALLLGEILACATHFILLCHFSLAYYLQCH